MTDLIEEFKKILEEEHYGKNTIYQYGRYLTEYVKQFGDPSKQTQKQVYKNIKNIQIRKTGKKHNDVLEEDVKKLTTAMGQTLKAVIAYLKTKGLPSHDITILFEMVKGKEQQKAEENKKEADETLPPFMTYYEMINDLYDTNEPEKIRQYLVNKLIILTNCRNQDLIATIIQTKNELDKADPKKNYIYVKGKTVKFIRNNYKTAKTYGTKITTTRDEKLANACRIVYQHDENHNVVPEKYWETNLSRFIHNSTFNLGETNIMKMYLKHYNRLAKAKQISEKRGTSLETLHGNYNIKNDEEDD